MQCIDMGFYTCFNIECILEPKYVEMIQDFIKNAYEWTIVEDCSDKYGCIKELLDFIKKNNYYHIYKKDDEFPEEIYYENYPPCGHSSRWGQYCEIVKSENNEYYIWKFTGEMKNYDKQIQQFIKIILINVSKPGGIIQCWLSNESTDYIYKYNDEELRKDQIFLF